MSQKDYYQILQISQGTTAGVIEAAYWDLARRYSTSLKEDPTVAYLMEELNEAYRVLATPDLRHQYDLSLGISMGTPRPRRRRFLWFGRAKREPRSKPPVPKEGAAVVAARQDIPLPAQDTTTHVPLGPVAPPSDESTTGAAVEAAPPPSEAVAPRPTAEGSGWLRWEMPPLQSFVVSVGVVVIFLMALVAGADLGLTLILGGVTIFFALFPWRFGQLPAAPPAPEKRREDEELKAETLRDSTAALVARWRDGTSGDATARQGSHQADASSSSDQASS